jgi:hypothetical protein
MPPKPFQSYFEETELFQTFSNSNSSIERSSPASSIPHSRAASPFIKSSSPGSSTPPHREQPPFDEPLPPQVNLFFSSVPPGVFPTPKSELKAQPWKKLWKEQKGPSADGRLIVACPKICVYRKFHGLICTLTFVLSISSLSHGTCKHL